MEFLKLYEEFASGDDSERIEIPSKYISLRGAVGTNLTPQQIIDEFNECFEGGYQLVAYREDRLFYGEEENGESDPNGSTADDIFLQLDDFYKNEG